MHKAAASSQSIYPGDGQAVSSAGRVPWPAIAAGVLWLAAGLSAGYWVLLAVGRSPATAVAAAPVALPVGDPATVARALGARDAPSAVDLAQAPPPAVTRYTLLGVVASAGSRGAALIAVGDEPARPYRVGATVDNGLVLQAVGRGTVRLGATVSGPTTVELAVPPLPGDAS
jgi:general secretion pathway protein C